MSVRRVCFSGYDSVQFLNHKEGFSNEPKTEILMLRWPMRVRANTTVADGVRCGRDPFLEPCSPSHAAVRLHAQCSRGLLDERVRELVRVGVCGLPGNHRFSAPQQKD